MRIIKYLNNVPNNLTAVINGDKEITFGNLKDISYSSFSQLHHQSIVALYLEDPLELVQAIIALDGYVSKVLLLSSDTNIDLISDLCNDANVNTIFTDKKNLIEKDIRARNIEERCQRTIATERIIPTEWIFATSGTTGKPKLVAHPIASLMKSTKIDIKKGKTTKWGQLYNCCRFAGFQVLLQSLLSGSTLLLPNLSDPIAHIITFLKEKGCNAISATPSMWRKIIMSPKASHLPMELITLGGEIADCHILELLEKNFPKSKIIHIYASTEASVGFSVHDKKEGFPLSYINEDNPNFSLKIIDDVLYVKNHDVQTNYLGTKKSFSDTNGYINTGDIVTIQKDRVIFQGRANGMINIGGNKLFPEEVERIILANKHVKQAYIYGQKNPIIGNIIIANIVLHDPEENNKSTIKKDIQTLCKESLVSWKRPAVIKIVESLELNSGQKLKRV